MKLAHTIDANGYMVEPVLVADDAENTATLIVDRCPDGYYKPQWNGTAWVEGLDSATLLQMQKDAKKSEIEQSYMQAIASGFRSNANGSALTYAADAQSLQELGWIRAVPEAQFPMGIDAKLQDGTHVILSYAQMQILINDGQAFIMNNRAKKLRLLNEADMAQTPSEVTAVSWT